MVKQNHVVRRANFAVSVGPTPKAFILMSLPSAATFYLSVHYKEIDISDELLEIA